MSIGSVNNGDQADGKQNSITTLPSLIGKVTDLVTFKHIQKKALTLHQRSAYSLSDLICN